ncbi:hypothetical protein [Parendozoicomonas sp. Alg238-R29]|uniref:hypothetical protein n=1 Tax=Parendozoicomonas sp. Alg238-R29 TaxID=2993446 RepID=UPI00248ED9C3|nr:hypothetical protein [Parendozoicomonas sp. Alg238-R29]
MQATASSTPVATVKHDFIQRLQKGEQPKAFNRAVAEAAVDIARACHQKGDRDRTLRFAVPQYDEIEVEAMAKKLIINHQPANLRSGTLGSTCTQAQNKIHSSFHAHPECREYAVDCLLNTHHKKIADKIIETFESQDGFKNGTNSLLTSHKFVKNCELQQLSVSFDEEKQSLSIHSIFYASVFTFKDDTIAEAKAYTQIDIPRYHIKLMLDLKEGKVNPVASCMFATEDSWDYLLNETTEDSPYLKEMKPNPVHSVESEEQT